MPVNLSLIFNLILLLAVMIAIGYLIKTLRQNVVPGRYYEPSLGERDHRSVDEIIAVRKLTASCEEAQEEVKEEVEDDTQVPFEIEANPDSADKTLASQMIVMFLLAKDKRQFAGYELLQTILAAGFRFGEGDLFHYHQRPNGQGPVMFSLAAATTGGVFDLQNIGAFNARGLCLFMQISGNVTIDKDRFNLLYETARQLSEGLDAYLLDENRRPLTKEGLMRYQRVLGVPAITD